ncbi:GlsB/YeaQ/YmgE family stress response membrane protein [Actinomadura macra]|uniref:GlsB/YeaQ/YmgE family stress response membrane protein n=1 Tax=Actinomadura macra TaxID=46164 RepID=UPI00082D0EF5|nr:transglycosylase [Actinomadura macra]
MTIGGISAAIVLGAVIGVLGRLIMPDRRSMPGWLLVVVGIVAAIAGTALSHLFGLERRGWDYWETVFQILLGALGVYLVAAFWPKSGTR